MERASGVQIRKSAHTGPAVIKLGGAWAKMTEHSDAQANRINELSLQLEDAQSQVEGRDIALAAFKEMHRLSEDALAEERDRVKVLEARVAELLSAREEDQKCFREESLTLHKRIADLEAENGRTTKESHQAKEEMRAAVAEAEVATKEKERSDEELGHLSRRVEESDAAREKLTAEVEELRLCMDQTARQRNNHQAHAELLLKEKNRYAAEVAKFKKEMEEGKLREGAVRPKSAHLRDSTNTSKAKVSSLPGSKQAPTQQALKSVQLERDALARRVHKLEKDNDDLLVRFRSASQARDKLEKNAKKNTGSSSNGGTPTGTPPSALRKQINEAQQPALAALAAAAVGRVDQHSALMTDTVQVE